MPIKFSDVFYVYSPKTPFQFEALRGVNIDIKDHSFTAIVGHTGSGKSTLIQHINALLLPTSGTIQVDDMTITAKEKVKHIKKFRKHAGLVFQFPEYQLFEESVEKDVAFGPRNFGDDEKVALDKAHKALREVGIDDDLFKRSPFELSGGQRRRVAIAGIIAMEPKVLVLDEPTAGLDPRGAQEMMDLFDKIHQGGTTVVLVTHDMNIVLRYASDVIVMKDGAIVKVTDPLSLFEGDYEDYNLEIPNLYHFAKLLKNGGYQFDMRNIRTIEDMAKIVKGGYHRG
ncbi:MAG TPA: energy-coupling factor transporter ATPase [Bacilli bacterium]|nr:energy-coupling factor transporter ATPase [Bacilli bacterium]